MATPAPADLVIFFGRWAFFFLRRLCDLDLSETAFLWLWRSVLRNFPLLGLSLLFRKGRLGRCAVFFLLRFWERGFGGFVPDGDRLFF